MRPIYFLAVMSLLLAAAGAHAEQKKVGFSLVFNCGVASNPAYCLADAVEAGVEVVLLKRDHPEMCAARTTQTFTYEGAMQGIESTRLSLPVGCIGPFSIAVLRSAPNQVQIPKAKSVNEIAARTDTAARKIAEYPDAPDVYRLAPTPPRVTIVGDATLLLYNYVSDQNSGPGALAIRNGLFRLEGDCVRDHGFFFVREKLHLVYLWSGCNSGQNATVVYDLSSGSPVNVYENGKFST